MIIAVDRLRFPKPDFVQELLFTKPTIIPYIPNKINDDTNVTHIIINVMLMQSHFLYHFDSSSAIIKFSFNSFIFHIDLIND